MAYVYQNKTSGRLIEQDVIHFKYNHLIFNGRWQIVRFLHIFFFCVVSYSTIPAYSGFRISILIGTTQLDSQLISVTDDVLVKILLGIV